MATSAPAQIADGIRKKALRKLTCQALKNEIHAQKIGNILSTEVILMPGYIQML